MQFPLWVRFLFWGVIVSAIALFGWKANGWRLEAARASQLETQLNSEREQHDASEAARINLAARLAEEQGKVHETVREVIRRVPTMVRDDRTCDLSDELVGTLNRARGYDK